jgi:hypothetical protein
VRARRFTLVAVGSGVLAAYLVWVLVLKVTSSVAHDVLRVLRVGDSALGLLDRVKFSVFALGSSLFSPFLSFLRGFSASAPSG